MLINGLGATATAVTVVIVLAAKFLAGAWLTGLLIPGLLIFMVRVRRHYAAVASELALDTPLDLTHLEPPIVVLPMVNWNKVAQKGLRFAIHLSTEVHVLHIKVSEATDNFEERWPQLVEAPASALGLPAPQLTVIPSPYRLLFRPILDFVAGLQAKYPNRVIAVLVPELVERHWYHYFLHNQRAEVLKALLIMKGTQRVNVITVPWYLKS
jgi:hypothetical protein